MQSCPALSQALEVSEQPEVCLQDASARFAAAAYHHDDLGDEWRDRLDQQSWLERFFDDVIDLRSCLDRAVIMTMFLGGVALWYWAHPCDISPQQLLEPMPMSDHDALVVEDVIWHYQQALMYAVSVLNVANPLNDGLVLVWKVRKLQREAQDKWGNEWYEEQAVAAAKWLAAWAPLFRLFRWPSSLYSLRS